jgi:uncharacterized protein with von Willebrand factor type A (vWA) domain
MESTLTGFITALRNCGVRISTSETIDAVNALELLGYENPTVLKSSLAATLAKSAPERETFSDCFDRFFALDRMVEERRGKDDDPDSGSDSNWDSDLDLELPEGISPLTRMALQGDSTGLALAMREAARATDLSGIRYFTQKGRYIQRVMNQMGLEGLNGDMARLSGSGGSGDVARQLGRARSELFDMVRDYVERQLSLFAPFASGRMAEEVLKDVKLSNIEQRDYQRIHAIVRKMIKRLYTVYSRRRKLARVGRIDFKRTLRENVANQGVLFDLKWKRKKVDRPDVMAICDVSRSVRYVSRFFLLFLYSLNEVVSRIRTFAFCSNLVEVSYIFEEYPLDEAIARLDTGTGVPISVGLTDYARALTDFKDHYLQNVTRRTVVFVLGDARNNYDDPRADLLKLVARKCRRIIWLNPEAPGLWGTGDSVMPAYLPHCSLARECNTLSHLEGVAGILLKMST